MIARLRHSAAGLACAVVAAGAVLSGQAPRLSRAANVDWPLHNLDLHNSRYGVPDQINAANVGKLALKWTFEAAKSEGIGAVTPVVIDGVMYFNAGSKTFAVNAETGTPLWTSEASIAFGGGRRGVPSQSGE